jgi:hypothetical protein
MAGGAISGNTHMVKSRWLERSGRVAKVAILVRRQMICRLDQVRTGGEELTYMTTFASTGNV